MKRTWHFQKKRNIYLKTQESHRAQALTRATDMVLHSDKSGLPKELPRYTRDKSLEEGKIPGCIRPRGVGNRFNIYFVCGEGWCTCISIRQSQWSYRTKLVQHRTIGLWWYIGPLVLKTVTVVMTIVMTS